MKKVLKQGQHEQERCCLQKLVFAKNGFKESPERFLHNEIMEQRRFTSDRMSTHSNEPIVEALMKSFSLVFDCLGPLQMHFYTSFSCLSPSKESSLAQPYYFIFVSKLHVYSSLDGRITENVPLPYEAYHHPEPSFY